MDKALKMIIIAAVIIAVLIGCAVVAYSYVIFSNVSGILQQRAMATGKESIQMVSSNIIVLSIIGNTDDTNQNIDSMNITITAAAGAGRLDLSQMVVKVGNNVNQSTLTYRKDSADATTFSIYSVRDPSGLFNPEAPLMDGSSLARVNIDLTKTSPRSYMPVRTQYHVELIPERGASAIIDGVTPAAYSATEQNLYP